MFTCQVSQLYDVVQKWDAVSTSIPQVVQRLVAVKELHEQGNTKELKLVCCSTRLVSLHESQSHTTILVVVVDEFTVTSLDPITIYECTAGELLVHIENIVIILLWGPILPQ